MKFKDKFNKQIVAHGFKLTATNALLDIKTLKYHFMI